MGRWIRIFPSEKTEFRSDLGFFQGVNGESSVRELAVAAMHFAVDSIGRPIRAIGWGETKTNELRVLHERRKSERQSKFSIVVNDRRGQTDRQITRWESPVRSFFRLFSNNSSSVRRCDLGLLFSCSHRSSTACIRINIFRSCNYRIDNSCKYRLGKNEPMILIPFGLAEHRSRSCASPLDVRTMTTSNHLTFFLSMFNCSYRASTWIFDGRTALGIVDNWFCSS